MTKKSKPNLYYFTSDKNELFDGASLNQAIIDCGYTKPEDVYVLKLEKIVNVVTEVKEKA